MSVNSYRRHCSEAYIIVIYVAYIDGASRGSQLVARISCSCIMHLRCTRNAKDRKQRHVRRDQADVSSRKVREGEATTVQAAVSSMTTQVTCSSLSTNDIYRPTHREIYGGKNKPYRVGGGVCSKLIFIHFYDKKL